MPCSHARATSGAAGRRYFADVLAGMSYTPEEISDFSGPDQEVTPSPPTPTTETRRTILTVLSEDGPIPRGPSSSPLIGDLLDRASRPRGPGDARGRPQRPRSLHLAPLRRRLRRRLLTELQDCWHGPELTSLKTDAIPGGQLRADVIGVLGLTTIKSLPENDRRVCRAFIRQHYPDGTANLTEGDVQKCIDIAAGWPDSANQHPVADLCRSSAPSPTGAER